MKDYKLLIEDKNGIWQVADLGGSKPAMNFQANNIAELENRQTNYSQALRCPFTKNNINLFGNINSFDVVSDFARKKHNCRLFKNDYCIAGAGSVLVVKKTNTDFETQIISGSKTFYDLLDSPMTELDLGSITRNEAACNPLNFDGKYVFGAATFIKGGAPIYQTALENVFPFIHFKTAIETLVSDKGYSLVTNLSSGDWDDLYLSLTSVMNNGVNVLYNEVLPFNQNLGFETQKDFFKVFTQLFGLTINVNNQTKTVYAYTFKKLYDNKSIAKDWSNKLVKSVSDECSYSLDNYAQNNYIKFLDNQDDNVTDSALFQIEDETLEKNKDLFVIPVQAGLDNLVGAKLVANIPLEEITDSDILLKTCPIHIVRKTTETDYFQVSYSVHTYNLMQHVKIQEFVDNFYPELKIMLSDIKYLEPLFWLTDKDIEDWSPFVPIYIQKYGRYFYINKISNYINGQFTKCQLIKL